VNDISLSNTVKREFLTDIKRGDVTEANVNAFVSESLILTSKWSVSTAARLDYFNFRYSDRIEGGTKTAAKAIVSPKVTVNYQASPNVHVYLRSGMGFHSNDTRVVVEQNTDILPRAYGADLGTNAKITDKLLVNLALWRLDLDQEFVYVGDEGIVEPSGKTKREGIDLSLRYEILPWLFGDADVNLTRARAKGEPEGAAYIHWLNDIQHQASLN
jgi:outer membrane receptor protein involved in Fe transport